MSEKLIGHIHATTLAAARPVGELHMHDADLHPALFSRLASPCPVHIGAQETLGLVPRLRACAAARHNPPVCDVDITTEFDAWQERGRRRPASSPGGCFIYSPRHSVRVDEMQLSDNTCVSVTISMLLILAGRQWRRSAVYLRQQPRASPALCNRTVRMRPYH